MSSSLTILHVDTALDWRGGQAQVEALVHGLAERGHRSVVVTPPGSRLAERLGNAHDLAEPVGFAGSDGLVSPSGGWRIAFNTTRGEWDWLAARRLRQIAVATRPDVLHAHSALAHAMVWLGCAGRMDVPMVVSRRVDFPVGGNWLSRRKYRHPAFYYLAISSAIRGVLIQGGVPSDRIFLVPSGVDPAKFTYRTDRSAARRMLGIGDGEFLVINVAALVDHKDQATLVRAAEIALREMPSLRFIVLGEGELRPELEAQIVQAGLGDRVRLLGFRNDVEACLAASDLFVLSSHLEGMCTSLLDAMLMEKPIVATRAGGVPDVVVDGETGLLVGIRQHEDLAAAIVRLARDTELRMRLAAAGARRVREHFTIGRTVELTLDAYRRALQRRAET
ncbi:MAG: glycosyltransferase [Candidatus Sumerlaeia bacterium]|nr:glycosyltransferase [Candidatus Sumerlaeia bacterium]